MIIECITSHHNKQTNCDAPFKKLGDVKFCCTRHRWCGMWNVESIYCVFEFCCVFNFMNASHSHGLCSQLIERVSLHWTNKLRANGTDKRARMYALCCTNCIVITCSSWQLQALHKYIFSHRKDNKMNQWLDGWILISFKNTVRVPLDYFDFSRAHTHL